MFKKVLAGFALLAILATVLAACSIHDTSGASGPSITMLDDVAVQHIITNGQWKNGVPDTAKESGAPSYNQTFNGNDSNALGPFTTGGTFHYYCTVHPGMNLTVIVGA
jgi:plastocyanin